MQDKLIKMTHDLEKSKEKNLKLQNDLVAAHKVGVVQKENNNSEQVEILEKRLLETEQQLATIENEKNAKISESSQVQNLKKMLQTKSEQVKQLKNRLSKYEKDED